MLSSSGVLTSTDETLVKNAQYDEMCLQEIFNRYEKLLFAKAGLFSKKGADFDDYLQEGRIGLYKAVLKFNPHMNVPFSHFAKLLVERQMLSFLRKNSRQKNVNEVSFEEDAFVSELTSHQNPENFVLDKESYNSIIELINLKLSKFEKKVINLYLQGKSYKQIARELDKTEKSVDNALCRIKNKIAMSLKTHSNICP